MRLVFFGTPDVAVPTLRALVAAGHDIALVVTRADKRRGRGGALSPTPVKAAALEMDLPVTHRVADVLDVDVDLGVLVVFGQIIKPDVLAHVDVLNIHPSLLPRWRGATPVESAILAGDDRTGVCVMKLEASMDTGPVYARAETVISPDEHAEQLLERLIARGTELVVDQLTDGPSDPVAQNGEATYAEKLTAERLHIDWSQHAEAIHRLVRVGGAWTTFRDKRLKVLDARVSTDDATAGSPGALQGTAVTTGSGTLILEAVQPEGKGVMAAGAWANGARLSGTDALV
jgi:methionyl-tRNA formyltransferase